MRTGKKICVLFLLMLANICLKGQTVSCIPTPTVIRATCTNTCSASVIFKLPAYSCYSAAPGSYSVVFCQYNLPSPFFPIIDTVVMTPGQYTLNNVCVGQYSLSVMNFSGGVFDAIYFSVGETDIHGSCSSSNTSYCTACDGSITILYSSFSSSVSFIMIPPTGLPITTTTSTPNFYYLDPGAEAVYISRIFGAFSFTNLCAGIYTVTAITEGSCSITFTQTVSQPAGYTSANLTVQNSQPEYCVGEPITFNFSGVSTASAGVNNPVSINMGECQSYNLCPSFCTGTKTIIYTYNNPGVYNVVVTDVLCPESVSLAVNIINCNDTPQDQGLPQCMNSFKPSPGDYILSFWVKEALSSLASVNTFSSGIKVNINGPASSTLNVYANGASNAGNRIIDGWQKVEQKITIPASATDVSISLMNNASSGVDVYFDDIRFHPFNASYKSYVYDPVSLRLSAELDERNYATFYEYDEEGQLIRVKKETERGIQTIKESRTSVVK